MIVVVLLRNVGISYLLIVYKLIPIFVPGDANDVIEAGFIRRCKMRLSTRNGEVSDGNEPSEEEVIWEWTEHRETGKGTSFRFS